MVMACTRAGAENRLEGRRLTITLQLHILSPPENAGEIFCTRGLTALYPDSSYSNSQQKSRMAASDPIPDVRFE
ncbi:hypothetical protein BRY73_03845 [Ochrobactrum sp. P6BS-III]|nr:hypothetical protein BRY73_03845 [Ochrobactrum sp. P6BS-III]